MKSDRSDLKSRFAIPKKAASRSQMRSWHVANAPIFLPSKADIDMRYTVCWGCRNHCGIAATISGGLLREIKANPYHPVPNTSYALYDTPLGAAKVWQTPPLLCAETLQRRDAIYDPLRVVLPLKRSGSRGSGTWEVISWEKLIGEVVNGGRLFSNIPGEEERVIPGFSSLYDKGLNQSVPIDPTHPDMGPKTNALVIYMGEVQDGPRQFIDRFARSFGTVNVFDAGQIKDENREVGLTLSCGIKGTTFGPDMSHAEFVLGFGMARRAQEFGQPINGGESDCHAGGRIHIVDVRSENPRSPEEDFTWIRPGGDGALAMGIVRWILDNNAYDKDYLAIPSAQGAWKYGQPNFTNSTWLVNVDRTRVQQGEFLTAQEAGLIINEPSYAKDTVVLDLKSGRLTPAMLADRASLAVDPDYHKPLRIHGIHCQTAFQILWQEAHRYFLQEYALFAGVHVEVLESLAQEFTRHGKQAVADFFRGPVMHTNGVYTARAIFTLNLLIGNVDWVGGYITGGGGADLLGQEKDARYNLDHWPGENHRVPYGVNLSRSGVSYEETSYYVERVKQGQSPYPALRPWFPYSQGLWEEMFAGLYQGYPYHGEIIVQYHANPAKSAPAIGGRTNSPWIELMTDVGKIPLFIAVDTKIFESSQYADYIVPDTVGFEGWGFSQNQVVSAAKTVGVGAPVIRPLNERTPEGESMSMEQFLIDVAKRIRLPGFGSHAFSDGGDLHSRAPYYLKMLANLAYDASYIHAGPEHTVSLGPVPGGGFEDMKVIAQWRENYQDALSEEEWRKVAYVLARGGRFENYLDAYEGRSLGAMCQKTLPIKETLAALRRKQEPVSAYWDLFYPPLSNHGRMWMSHRFGSARALKIYSQDQAHMRNALTGRRFLGTGSYQPLQNMMGQHADQADFIQGFPFVLTSRKNVFEPSRQWGKNVPDVLVSLPVIDMNPEDAQKNGWMDEELVRVKSVSYPLGVSARIRIWPGQRPGVLSFVQNRSDGPVASTRQQRPGDGAGQCSTFNALMRCDESLKAGPWWSIALEDPVGGGIACDETRVRIEKMEAPWTWGG